MADADTLPIKTYGNLFLAALPAKEARLLQSEHPLGAALDEFMHQRHERCRMIVENSELLGEWEKKPGTRNEDTVGIIAASYRALAKPV